MLMTPSTPVSADAPIGSLQTQVKLSIEHITKRFSGMTAVDDVSADFSAGEVHVLFGENGAGKSTLINVISGVYKPDAGRVRIEGADVSYGSVIEARRHGVATVFQEFSLAPHLTVAENITLGSEARLCGFSHSSKNIDRAQAILNTMGFEIAATGMVKDLTRAQRQMVEIAKALLAKPKVLILDEPTSSLSTKEAAALFEAVRQLKSANVAIIYITHRIAEIFSIGDRVTVLRDGCKVTTVSTSDTNDKQLVELMTGRVFGTFYPALSPLPCSSHSALTVESISAAPSIHDVSFSLRQGEVAALAGLVGSGKSDIARAIFGLVKLRSGKISIQGASNQRLNPRRCLRAGVFYLSADRIREGAFLNRSLAENISMAALGSRRLSRAGWIRRRSELVQSERLIDDLSIRPRRPALPLASLSGGNQQKAIIARALLQQASIFLLDEPTVGIDVAAKHDIYELIVQLAAGGAAVLLVSSDMSEVINISHRVLVVHDGRIVAEFRDEEKTERNITSAFFLSHTKEGAK